MAVSLITTAAGLPFSVRSAALSSRRTSTRRLIVVRGKGFNEKIHDVVETIKEYVHPDGDIDTENPTAAHISRPGADSPVSGTGADAFDPNSLGRKEGNLKIPVAEGKHGLVSKRDAYLVGTPREAIKEKYLYKQDEREDASGRKHFSKLEEVEGAAADVVKQVAKGGRKK